jgi:hypothetical protein
MRAVRHAIAHQKVHDGRHREVDQDLHQRIDLVLLAHGAQLEKSKTGVHGQHHDGAEKNEQRICALFECVHESFLQFLI